MCVCVCGVRRRTASSLNCGWDAIASRNSSREMAPEPSLSIVRKTVRSCSTSSDGAAKARSSSAILCSRVAVEKAWRERRMPALCCMIVAESGASERAATRESDD